MSLRNYVMRLMHKVLFNLGLFVAVLILIYAFFLRENVSYGIHDNHEHSTHTSDSKNEHSEINSEKVTESIKKNEEVSLWCIFTKVDKNTNLKYKFETFSKSILPKSSKPIILNVITDNASRPYAEEVLADIQKKEKFHNVVFHDVSQLAEKLKQLVSIMSPHFSSRPGTYYSDALFFLSLGLHHIISPIDDHGGKAIMMDIDVKVMGDIAELWSEFDSFKPTELFGLGPELSPVYRHVFHTFRSSHPDTRIGEPISEQGYPGVNSGVILLNLDGMRKSKLYAQFIGDNPPQAEDELRSKVEEGQDRIVSVEELVKKYSFRGHLGDQDFYTLLGAEHPEILHILPCTWNRQLCTWWGDKAGYGDVFDRYFKCEGKIKVYHGNCNTPFPEEAK
ncbi:hypothetical protein J437_LFUL005430 [Ladona fulva]|uniref:Xyloside xylosyltransferase 1 n=1 Tax=Ladona fulva TaxID=123851 RepID=A0A8K0NVV3_LADFU|nr:hypothetical protein J437_LFUL005430 [Ladona fulva]